jgi:hypothetical protein
MSEWRIVSPAPASATLELAGRSARVRRLVLAQVRTRESACIMRGDQPMLVAMFQRHGWRRTEVAMAISPDAAQHMRRILRMAQLTLWQMADARLIVAHVNPVNPAGQRMAMLIGFTPARLTRPGHWVFRR